jgi:hypothetical protein
MAAHLMHGLLNALRRGWHHGGDALLGPMHLAEQVDPEMAVGFRRLRAATQQHREALLEMLVQSDPSTLARDAIAGHPADAFSLPMSPSALR